MSTLDANATKTWKQRLEACNEPWLVAAIDAASFSELQDLQGVVGLIDWRLHGQLSNLLNRRELAPGKTAVLASHGKIGKAALLVSYLDTKPNPQTLLKTIQQLHVQKICLAESTFPGDFFSKLKENLTKEGIQWVTLESKTT